MHSSRSRLVATLLLGLTAAACASGGTSTTNGTEPAPSDNTTQREFPPGTEPTRNTWTRSAQVYLDQAENTDAADEKQRRYSDALEQARMSVQNQPNNPLGYYQAGIALTGLAQYQEAAAMFDRAEELYPRYVLETGPRRQNAWVSLYNQAVQALQSNEEDRAIELMQRADVIYQGRPEARTNLAIIYTNRGEYEQAIEWYRKTLETLRSDEVQYMPANVQAEWADLETDAIFNMAQVYQRMGQPAEATRLYREYLADNPDDAGVKVQLALLLSSQGQDDEAAAMFAEVLNMEGLEADEYYQIGIGLFNAGRFDDAVIAFERAVAANPYFRDAVYNLAQSLLAQANARDDAGASDAELVPLYERLAEIGESLRRMDPYSRTAAIVTASAYRSLADITSGATSTEWRNRLLASLEAIEALPFDVSNVSLNQVAPGRIQVNGTVENLTLNEGDPIGLRISLVGPQGTELSTQEVTVAAPAPEQSASFRAEFTVEGEIAGWRYDRM